MDVLRFECTEYRLTISTADVSYAWERFERRVKDEAFSYCDYKSSCEGKLSLFNPKEISRGLQILNPEVPQTEWRLNRGQIPFIATGTKQCVWLSRDCSLFTCLHGKRVRV